METQHYNCPKCQSEHTYQDGSLWTCTGCFHEWSPASVEDSVQSEGNETHSFLDSNGVLLQNGDTVTTIKDLKAGKETIKAGTKVKNIRLLDTPVNDHDISCKIPGHGSMYLKCSVVKKV